MKRPRSIKRKVLILGSRNVAQLLANQLKDEGFDPEIHAGQGAALPLAAHPDGLKAVRAILAEFARSARSETDEIQLFLHPGVSGWAERPELPVIAQEFSIQFLGPPSRVLNVFNNKLNLLLEAEALGIPNLILGTDLLHSVREIERYVERQGLRPPFILKTLRGGVGGFGIFVLNEMSDFERKLPLWLEQLQHSFGEVILFAERYLDGSRSIVMPFVRFADGRTEVFTTIDASLQFRNRKVIQICPASGIDPALEEQLREWVEKLAARLDYVGLGSFEFLVDSSRGFLIEGLARLEMGYHLWENVTGVRAVSWQLAALGYATNQPPLKREPSPDWSTGISVRIYAEDPLLQLPQPGEIREIGDQREWKFPGAAAQLMLSLQPGDGVPPAEHGLLGVLWVGARDREHALLAARGILGELWIAGELQTNELFLSDLLAHPWVREGIFHCGFVDEEFVPSTRVPVEAIAVSASVAWRIQGGPDTGWTAGDLRVKPSTEAVKWVGEPEFWSRNGLPGASGQVELPDGHRFRLCVFPVDKDRWQVRLGPWFLRVKHDSSAAPKISALVKGRVHAILFREGARIPAHEPLVVVESLGILVPHALPVDVRVSHWKVQAEDSVLRGQELAEFEILGRASVG